MEARSPARVGGLAAICYREISLRRPTLPHLAAVELSSRWGGTSGRILFRQDHCRRRCRVAAPVRVAVIVDVSEKQSDQEHSDTKDCQGAGGSPIVSVTGSAWPIIVPQFEFVGRRELLIWTSHFRPPLGPRKGNVRTNAGFTRVPQKSTVAYDGAVRLAFRLSAPRQQRRRIQGWRAKPAAKRLLTRTGRAHHRLRHAGSYHGRRRSRFARRLTKRAPLSLPGPPSPTQVQLPPFTGRSFYVVGTAP